MNRLSIRSKLFLGMVSVSLSFILLSIFLTGGLMGRMGQEELARGLGTAKKAHAQLARLQTDLLSSKARSMAQTPYLKAVLGIPDVDHDTVLFTAIDLYRASDVDLLLVLDARGSLLADPDRPTRFGDDFGSLSGVEVSQSGQSSAGIWTYGDGHYNVVVTPVVIANQILAHLCLGKRVDDDYARRVRETTDRDVLILCRGRAIGVASDRPDLVLADREVGALLELFDEAGTAGPVPIQVALGGLLCYAKATPFSDAEGLTVFFQAVDEADRAVAVVRTSVVVSGLLAVILTLTLGMWVSARVTRPILELRDAAEQLGTGNLEGRVVVRAKDEIGHLADSYNRMAENLQSVYGDLEDANQTLEDRVAERTMELRQEIQEHGRTEEVRRKVESELEAQQTLAVRSDRLRSLGEMAAGIAHELNQPLVGVRGLAEHLLISLDRGWSVTNDKLKDRLAGIVEQADRMVHIIDHVRMFAREAGKPDVSPISVNEVVSSGMGLIEAQFKSHDVTLEADFAEDLPLVLANPYSLEEVLINLMNNARDAFVGSRNGGAPCISLRTYLDAGDAGPEVGIEVADNGCGIAPEILAKIWDPFFTTKDPDKGTGLGLSISRTIVENFGGTMDVSSSEREGTKITIVLPQVEIENQSSDLTEQAFNARPVRN